MAVGEFRAALNQVANDRNIKIEDVLGSIEESLLAAYQKDYEVKEEDIKNLSSHIDPETGEMSVFMGKKNVTPAGFGRIASQTAKQVIFQKIREAEKASLIDEFKGKLNTIVQGYIFRIDRDNVVMDIGKTQGIIPPSEKVALENYQVNQKYKVLIKEVTEDINGSQIILSRKDPAFIEKLFEEEVPEIAQGVVKIEKIAREAGQRTKVAVSSKDPKIDPSGACIGQKGSRVQAVTDELNGEKIDIINYNPNIDRFIAAALSPATVLDIIVDSDNKTASVRVVDDQLSLAIGNNGQNVRLAAKLTDYRININGSSTEGEEKAEEKKAEKKKEEKSSTSDKEEKSDKPKKTAKKTTKKAKKE